MNNSSAKRMKEEDRRAGGKFIIMLIVSLLVGFAFGFAAIKIRGDLGDKIGDSISDFLFLIAPYAINICTIITAIATYILYKKSHNLYNNWDGENEDEMDQIEGPLGFALMLFAFDMIITYFLFAVGFRIDSFGDSFTSALLIRIICLIVGLFLSLFVITFGQQKIINFTKEINPEKRGSIFDVRFKKKWEDSCDEAEKLTIYKCAYKAYQAGNSTCVALWVFCVIGSFIWDFGIVPVTMVMIIWTVLVTSYYYYVSKLSKNPSDIHM
jgi:hypothetical protein